MDKTELKIPAIPKDTIEFPDGLPFWAEQHKWANLHYALYYNFVNGNTGHYDMMVSPEIGTISDEKIKAMCEGIIKCTCSPAEFFAKYDFSSLGLDSEVSILKEALNNETTKKPVRDIERD